MPITPEHLSALRAYAGLWEPVVTAAQIDAVFAPGFEDHRTGAEGAGVDAFREHRAMAFDALSGLSARYEPVAGDGQRFAAQATVAGVHCGGFFGVAATGRAVSWRDVHLVLG